MKFPEDYPFNPPTFTFNSPFFHVINSINKHTLYIYELFIYYLFNIHLFIMNILIKKY